MTTQTNQPTEKETEKISLESMKQFYTEQLSLLKLQLEYVTLRKEIAQAEAERIEAIAKTAYFTNPPKATNPQDSPEATESED